MMDQEERWDVTVQAAYRASRMGTVLKKSGIKPVSWYSPNGIKSHTARDVARQRLHQMGWAIERGEWDKMEELTESDVLFSEEKDFLRTAKHKRALRLIYWERKS